MAQAQDGPTVGIDIEAWRTRIRRDVLANYHYHMAEGIARLERNCDAALAHLRACLEQDPDHLLALGDMVALLEGSGRAAEASTWREAARQRFPAFAASLALARGWDACNGGAFDRAGEHLSEARGSGADPDACAALEAETLLGRAAATSAQGRTDEAMDLLREAGALRPAWAPPRRLLASLLETLGRTKEALEAWRWVLTADPDHGEANLKVGYALEQQGSMTEALPLLRRAVAGLPGNDFALAHCGFTLMVSDSVGDAVAMLQRAVDLNPGSGFNRCHLGMALLASGDARGCMAVFAEAERQFDPDPDCIVVAALALLHLGQADEARRRLDDPVVPKDHPVTPVILALLSLPSQNAVEAIAVWRRLAQDAVTPYPGIVLSDLLDHTGHPREAQDERDRAAASPFARLARRLLPAIRPGRS